jgi:hypothetical protein
MAAAEISEAAEGWLRTHPQLFAEALERVCASPTLRPFLERELAKRGKEITAALMHNSPSVDLLGLPLCKCQERNGGTDDHRLRSGFDGRQTLDAQQAALKAAGAERVFAEKVSGVVTDRKALGRAVAALEPGDVLVVTRLDRLARSTRDLLNVLATVAERGAGFRSIADA